MTSRTARRKKRASRLHIRVERIVLGAIMSVAVFVVERRLRKALGIGGTSTPEDDAIPKTVGLS